MTYTITETGGWSMQYTHTIICKPEINVNALNGCSKHIAIYVHVCIIRVNSNKVSLILVRESFFRVPVPSV